MRNYCRMLSWALVVGFLTMPGAGKVAAQAMATDSATVTATGPVTGTSAGMFLNAIGRGNPFSAPSFSVVQFNAGDLGYISVSEVDAVTLQLTQSLFGGASKGPLAFYVTEDTVSSIEPGTMDVRFLMSDVHGLGTQLAPLHFLGTAKFKPVRSGTVNTYTFSVTDPALQSYLSLIHI